jgi:putative hemolysin
MSLIVIIGIPVLIVLLGISAFFSSAETVFFSLNTIEVTRITKRRPRIGQRLKTLLEKPTQLLSTIIIANTLVNVVAAGLGFMVAEAIFPGYGEMVSIIAMTLLLLILGEIAPKRIAIDHAARMAEYYIPILTFLMRALSPVRAALNALTSMFRDAFTRRKPGLSENEFLTGIAVGEEEGVLDQEERTMVNGIVRLEQIQTSDVMTPRVDVIGLDLDDTPEKHREIAKHVTYRYLPVYRESLDNPTGVLDVPRFLLSDDDDIEKHVQPVTFVPETAPLDSLLATMQRERQRIAIVVDEYGGTAGFITRGDILEEIVEDVDDEHGESKLTIHPLREGAWLVSGDTSLEDIAYEIKLDLAAEGVDRIAGWVTAQLERIPRVGDTVDAQGCRATVQRLRRHRVVLVLLELSSKGESS